MVSDDARLARQLADPGSRVTWVFTGDSITHGMRHTAGARNYVDHLHELIRGDADRVGDWVINTAVSGDRIPDLVKDWHERAVRWAPDVVSLMIGTNDCAEGDGRPFFSPDQFADGLAGLITAIRELGAIPIVQTPPWLDVHYAPERARFDEFVAQIRAVSDRHDVIVVDHAAAWHERFGAEPPLGLMSDQMHPNAAGHAAMAALWARTIGCVPAGSPTLLCCDALAAQAG